MIAIRSIFRRFKPSRFAVFLLLSLFSLTSCDSGAYKRGYSEGLDVGFQQGHASGLEDGYASGRASGLKEGFASGYSAGLVEGFENGFRDGQTDGLTKGRKEGYFEGQKAFIGDHWTPSIALGVCLGLGLLVCYGTLLLCWALFRWSRGLAVIAAMNLRYRLLAGWERLKYLKKLKKQEAELAEILKAKAEFACALHLRNLGLNAADESILTDVQRFIQESVILPELTENLKASMNSLRDASLTVGDSDISSSEKRSLWQQQSHALDLDWEEIQPRAEKPLESNEAA